MNDDIRAAIERSLPAEVGKTLQHRLLLCDALEKESKQLSERIAVLEKRRDEVEKSWTAANEVLKREAALAKAERELEIAKAKLEVERRMTQELREQNQQVVLAVFANSRYKYQERETVPVIVPCSGGSSYVQGHDRTRTVESEGDAPRPT